LQSYIDAAGTDLSLQVTELCTLTSVQLRFLEWERHSHGICVQLKRKSLTCWEKLVADFGSSTYWGKLDANAITSSIFSNALSVDELLWLVDTISQLQWAGSLRNADPRSFIDISHSILFCFVKDNGPAMLQHANGVLLLNAVVILAAIVLLPEDDDLLVTIFTEQQNFPWSLSGLRSPQLLVSMIDSAHSNEQVRSQPITFFSCSFSYSIEGSHLLW